VSEILAPPGLENGESTSGIELIFAVVAKVGSDTANKVNSTAIKRIEVADDLDLHTGLLLSGNHTTQKEPPTSTVSGLCSDVGYQDALTVLVIASNWTRGGFSFTG
jgi:hypothetical protein